MFDVPRDFPTEFAAAKAGPDRILTLNALNTRLPIYTKGYSPDRLTTSDVYIVTDVALPSSDVNIAQGSNSLTLGQAAYAIGKNNAMSAIHTTDGPAGGYQRLGGDCGCRNSWCFGDVDVGKVFDELKMGSLHIFSFV